MSTPKYDEDTRKIRKLAREYLPTLLSKGPLTSKEIIIEIKKKFPKNCNDETLCTCGRGSGGVMIGEWKHQILWAIQDSKYYKKIEYNKNSRKYSIKK